MRKPCVCVALAQPETREALSRTLRLEKIAVREFDSIDDLVDSIDNPACTVIVLDLSLCNTSCGAAIHHVRTLAPSARLIVCTPHSEERDASAIEEGVFYYAAGVDVSQLAEAVRAGLRLMRRVPPP